MTTCNPDVIPMQPVPQTADWLTVLKQYGLATLLTLLLLLYLAFYVVEPQRKAQERFMESVIETNKVYATTVSKQTEIQFQQAQALKGMEILLQQIRDAHSSGAWRNTQAKGEE